MTIKNQPLFKHDCDKCLYLFTVITYSHNKIKFEFDIYFCEAHEPTYVFRYGSDGPDYYSSSDLKYFPYQCDDSPDMEEAVKLAKRIVEMRRK